MLRLLGGGEVLYRISPSTQLLTWVRIFDPEVIYGHCSDLQSVRFLRGIQRVLGIPLVLHLMDDWPESLYRKGWPENSMRSRYLAEFADMIRSAAVTIAICQEMAEEYERRFHRQVLWLPMPVELEAYRAAARTQWTANHPFRLRYGGRVGWAIHDSLADIARAVQMLRREGRDVAFDLVTFQTEQVPLSCRASAGVNVHIPAPLVDLPRLQTAADVLIVCYDFDSESVQHARYSMPSKLADCMASGTPIIVYGPPGLPVVEYARKCGWGMVVDRCDARVLGAAISELMDSATLREDLGRTAMRFAHEQHDAAAVSGRLRTILQNVAESSVSGCGA
jgi:glycosyltransferase involved in cell wall biosynthesis